MYYYIYLCPVGALALQIEAFRLRLAELAGSNGALQYPIHATLTGRFHPALGVVNDLIAMLEAQFAALSGIQVVVEALYHNPMKAAFGFSISAPDLEAVMKKVRGELPPQKFVPKNLHVTLAAGYAPEHDETLLDLAVLIDLKSETNWEVRLYSVDDGKFNIVKTWPIA